MHARLKRFPATCWHSVATTSKPPWPPPEKQSERDSTVKSHISFSRSPQLFTVRTSTRPQRQERSKRTRPSRWIARDVTQFPISRNCRKAETSPLPLSNRQDFQ